MSEKLFASARVQYLIKERRPHTTMHDWNHDGKIDLRDGFIQDEIESRNSGNGNGGGSTSNGSGGCCIIILLIPVIILLLYAIAKNAPSGVYSIVFFLFAAALLLGGLIN